MAKDVLIDRNVNDMMYHANEHIDFLREVKSVDRQPPAADRSGRELQGSAWDSCIQCGSSVEWSCCDQDKGPEVAVWIEVIQTTQMHDTVKIGK